MAKRPRAQTEALIARAYQDMWQSPVGRQVLSDLLLACHIFQPSFAPDDRTTAFNEGERNIGLRIARYLDLQPQEIVETWRQANDATTNWYDQSH